MSMIELKGSAMEALDGKYGNDGSRRPVASVEKAFHDAFADVEDGVEFWKTLAGSNASKRRASPEFLNRNG